MRGVKSLDLHQVEAPGDGAQDALPQMQSLGIPTSPSP